MNKLPNHTALKEWASAIDALGRGTQVVLIRKGGIADPAFGVEAQRFYLFPTNFHDGGGEPPRVVSITHWCEAVRTWRVRDLEALYRLEPLVVFDRATLETRYRFRADQAVHVIGVRTYRLARPATVAMKDDYAGCRSWVSIDEEVDVDGSVAVLSEVDLAARFAEIEALLAPAAAAVAGD
ncbi:MAG TPA: DUF1802 family protein [Thermoanaerobaculia bacterium]|nr:DUF1802 family protein [Thermoanaerobaculia bacterium]